MFSLKPILLDQTIELPKCMYQLKPVNSEQAGNMSNSANLAKSDVELLEENQNRILMKLEELKKTLLVMRGDLKLCNKPAQPSISAGSQAVKKLPVDVSNLDLVINVNPSQVPWSVLAIKNLWKGRVNLHVDTYTHSSVKQSDVSKAAKDFAEKVAKNDQNKLPTLKVTIIWKGEIETTQMLTSPSCTIYAEVNILRFLNRVGPNELRYESDNHSATLNDATLDICYQLSKKLSPKERQSYLQLLSQRLGDNQFYNNSSSLGISDISVSSTLKKMSLNSKELPANLSSWQQKIVSIAGY